MSDVAVPHGFIDLGPQGRGMPNNRPKQGPVIDDGLEDTLKRLPVVARHSGWEFHGYVWWNGRGFTEVVYQRGEPVASAEASTLDDLMRTVNDRFGWL